MNYGVINLQSRSVLFDRQLRWVQNHKMLSHGIDDEAKLWIFEELSLTRRIKKDCGNKFGLTVLRQRRNKPFPDEARLLNIARYQHALVREVVLHCGQLPLITARTIIPWATLRGAQRRLSYLGNRPLGEVIFAYPELKRLSLDLAKVESTDWCEGWAEKWSIRDPVWGRRTVYSIAGSNLLVCEVFLPPILSLK